MRGEKRDYLNGRGVREAQLVDGAQERAGEVQLVERAGNVLGGGLGARVEELLARGQLLVLPLHDRLHALDHVLRVLQVTLLVGQRLRFLINVLLALHNLLPLLVDALLQLVLARVRLQARGLLYDQNRYKPPLFPFFSSSSSLLLVSASPSNTKPLLKSTFFASCFYNGITVPWPILQSPRRMIPLP